MKSFRRFSEEVVPFGGGTSKWQWTIKHHFHDTSGEHDKGFVLNSTVDLPNQSDMLQNHIKKLINQHSEAFRLAHPDYEHVSQYGGALTATDHIGTHWFDKEGEEGSNFLTHKFRKID